MTPRTLHGWLAARATALLLAASVAPALGGCNSGSAGDGGITAPVASVLSAVSGGGQTVFVGSAATNPLAVRVVDQSGNPIAGTAVTWAITSGAGTLAPTVASTDATGAATTRYTAGSATGSVTITATVAGLGTVTFTMFVVSRPPTA